MKDTERSMAQLLEADPPLGPTPVRYVCRAQMPRAFRMKDLELKPSSETFLSCPRSRVPDRAEKEINPRLGDEFCQPPLGCSCGSSGWQGEEEQEERGAACHPIHMRHSCQTELYLVKMFSNL